MYDVEHVFICLVASIFLFLLRCPDIFTCLLLSLEVVFFCLFFFNII